MPKIDKSKMKCNKPKRQISGGKKSVVKACKDGKEKIIAFDVKPRVCISLHYNNLRLVMDIQS